MNGQENGNDQEPEANPPASDGDDAATNRLPEISGEDFEFAEPELDSAEISADVAESVNLDEVEAEAAAVEREAARSAELPASEIIASVPKSGIAFDTPTTHGDWEVDESTVLRTDFSQPPVANNPWTPPAGPAPLPPRPATPPEQTAPTQSEPTENEPAEGGQEAPTSHLGHSVDDGSGWRRPETQWQPRANAWQSPGQVAQGVVDAATLAAAEGSAEGSVEGGMAAGQPTAPVPQGQAQLPYGSPVPPGVPPSAVPAQAGSQPPYGATGHQGPDQGTPGNKNKLFIILGVAVFGVALVVLLIWMLIGLLTGGSKTDSAGSAPVTSTASTTASQDTGDPDLRVSQASPLKWLTGDCLRGFTTVAKPADIVQCNSPHSAQVVGTFKYDSAETFPGADALKAKGVDVCTAVSLTDAAKAYTDLKTFRGLPTAGSWETGDRTIQCIVVDPTGENLKTSLVR